MITLFNLDDYETTPKPTIDPFWDELVLDCSGKVEPNGQTTLFYDDSDEPPDPDDFPNIDDYLDAWHDWHEENPDYKPDMSPFPEQAEEDFTPVLEESPGESPTLPEQKYKHWIEEYYVLRNGVKHWYYRYCYYDRKIFHIHIPGGNHESPLSIERKNLVESAIAQNVTHFDIQNLIRGGFQAKTPHQGFRCGVLANLH